MSNRRYTRKEENHYVGKENSYVFRTEEDSVFLDEGHIASRRRSESPVIQGLVPHDPTDIGGQCQNCRSFATKQMIVVCDCCWQVVCLPCASRKQNLTVCPACAQYLAHRRWIQILRELFIEPFVERIG